MRLTITAKAPTRVDLLGGTLDLWPLHYLFADVATINMGVTLFARASVEVLQAGEAFSLHSDDQGQSLKGSWEAMCASPQLPLATTILQALWAPNWPPLRLSLKAESPLGAGLGGSSCLGVCLAAALARAREKLDLAPPLAEGDLVRQVQNIEARLLHGPAGCQDHWGAVRGRLNILTYPYAGVQVQTLTPEAIKGCQEGMILCYSGKSRFSGMNNWELYKRLLEKDATMLAHFQRMGQLAWQARQALLADRWSQVLELSEKEWHIRKQLWPGIETAETQALDRASRKAGAYFSRVCGAGGGGVMVVFTDFQYRRAVENSLKSAGGVLLPATISQHGLLVE